MMNFLAFQLRHVATFSRWALIVPVLALLVVALVFAAFVAGCSGKPEAQPAPPTEVQKSVPKPADVPKPPPKPNSQVPAPKPTEPAPEPAAKKTEPTAEPQPEPEAKPPFDISGPVRETESGRLHMRADVTSNLAASVKARVTFVLSKDKEGKEVIHRLPLIPMEVVLEPGKPTRVSIHLEGTEPKGQYYCNVLVEPVK